jgi:soluble lytic murein transglycosylase-like protein
MSIEAVISRVSQLQAMLASSSPQPAPTTATPSSTSFSTALQNATSGATPTSFSSLATGTPATTAASASSTSSALPAGTPYAAEITAAATANGVDPALLAGLVKQESGFNPNAGSGAGARGLTQLMPSTAAGLGVSNVLDPVQSLNGGAKYLKQQLDTFGGDVTKALAAYNAGPGAVNKYGGTIPPYRETQDYVSRIRSKAGVGGMRAVIYKITELVDGEAVVRYSNQKPPAGTTFEVVQPRRAVE